MSFDKEENEKEIWFNYFIQDAEAKYIKMGISQDTERRLKELQSSNPHKLKIIVQLPRKSKKIAREWEEDFQDRFKDTRIRGEWYRQTPYMLDFIEFITYQGDWEEVGVGEWEKDFPNPQYWEALKTLSDLFHKDYQHGNYRVIREVVQSVKNLIKTGHV